MARPVVGYVKECRIQPGLKSPLFVLYLYYIIRTNFLCNVDIGNVL